MICGRRLWARGGEDEWAERDGKLRCSYCGSLKPEDVLVRLKAGEIAVPTDKDYKLYVGESRDKFYFQHMNDDEAQAFVDIYNAGMKLAYPGHFYVSPFFMRPA